MNVETIFDHGITSAEVIGILGAELSKEEYLSLVTDQDSEFAALYRLFSFRGDDKTAQEYFGKIKSLELRAAITEVNEGIIYPPL